MRDTKASSDLKDAEDEEAHRVFTKTIAVLMGILGRDSRWNDTVELTDSLFSSGVAHLDGRVEITRAVWRQPQFRWRTLIHEALHLFSPSYSRYEYSLARGWEEGVVEQTQRLLRQTILRGMGVTLAEDIFLERDERHEYNAYIETLEGLRRCLSMPMLDFYLWLLATPLPDRLARVQERGERLPSLNRIEFRRTLLLSQAKLGRIEP